jgi:decaprenylphospho-beta-D-ribofuranose 2-oxidase
MRAMQNQWSAVNSGPLSGWGRYPVVEANTVRPETWSSVDNYVKNANSDALIARGKGRSYGDASVNDNGLTILLERFDRFLAFNNNSGDLHLESGVTLEEIINIFAPRGWFPAVVPGTKYVTVGGAIAADIHGKNHHRDGSFCNFVKGFTVIVASGEKVFCSREQNSDLFWATIGGMGLTGIITDVQITLKPIESVFIDKTEIKAKNLDAVLALFDEHEKNYQYSVAWIDCLARGKDLGRSILMLGNSVSKNDERIKHLSNPLSLKEKRQIQVPLDSPDWLLNSFTMGTFNSLFYAKQMSNHHQGIADFESYFFPLDAIGSWNRLYGKRGFIQHQTVFPEEASREALKKLLTMTSENGWGSFLAVLKRFGPQDGWLSFPHPGYTLTLDIAVKDGLFEFLKELESVVLNYGGRIYLAKDSFLSPEGFRKMYPRFADWQKVKAKYDPKNTFSSHLAQRLEIR